MHTSIRAARTQTAMETIIAEADILGDRFGIPFDAEAVNRRDRDPLNRALFQMEAVATFLTAVRTSTDPVTATEPERTSTRRQSVKQ